MKRLAMLAASCAIAIPGYAQSIATVNGKAITQQQLDDFLGLLVEQGAQDSPGLRDQIKQDLISRLVAVQAAEKAGIQKKPSVKLEIELARQGILAQALMKDYLEKNPVTDKEIQAEYDKIKKDQEGNKEYKLRHILVKEEQKAKDLIADINSKKISFEEAAKKDSTDPGSGANGGELGWAPASNYVPEFARAAEKLKKGEMTSAPVRTQFGWHIIQAEDERPVTVPELKDVKPQLEEMLKQERLAKFQEDMMKSAEIK